MLTKRVEFEVILNDFDQLEPVLNEIIFTLFFAQIKSNFYQKHAVL